MEEDEETQGLNEQEEPVPDFGEVIRREDGSFVINRNGSPYHVPDNDEFHELYLQVQAYVNANPDKVSPEPPPEPPPPPQDPALNPNYILDIILGMQSPD